MINLIEIDNVIKRINNTYNTTFVYKIVQTSGVDNHFADLEVTNERLKFKGWQYSQRLYYDLEFNILELYDSLIESWVEVIFEDE